MISKLLKFIPGVGPFLSIGWRAANSTAGRLVIVGAVMFGAGWKAKDRQCDAATARAVIAKQQIDLRAAQDQAAQANQTVEQLSQFEAKNQEIINGLQQRLSQRPATGACGDLDPADADSLRRLEQ